MAESSKLSPDQGGAKLGAPGTNGADTSWVFPGWGKAQRVTDIGKTEATREPTAIAPQHKLGEWRATAICGNDITSSVLYVAAIVNLAAAALALFVLEPLRRRFIRRSMEARAAERIAAAQVRGRPEVVSPAR